MWRGLFVIYGMPFSFYSAEMIYALPPPTKISEEFVPNPAWVSLASAVQVLFTTWDG